MKRQWIQTESLKWLHEGIINEEQRNKILNQYEKRNHQSLIYFFGAILIGLACLTLVSQYWHDIYHLIRIGIIIFFLLLFYLLGNYFFEKNKTVYAVTCTIIALAIFGAGIFLSGEMYHYSLNDGLAFFIWGIVAFLIYLSRPHPMIFFSGLLVLSAGQLFSSMNLIIFDWSLFALFIFAFGTIVLIKKNALLSHFFALLYIVHVGALALDYFGEIYWIIPFVLLLFIGGTLIKSSAIKLPFQSISVGFMFVYIVVQVFIFDNILARGQLDVHFSYYILLIALIIGAVLLIFKDDSLKLPSLALFFPTFLIEDYSLLFAYIILFIFSTGKLIEGYDKINERKVIIGTTAFLISTFIVYVQVAWDYFNRSVFFLIGGLLLFIIGFLLERHRKKVMAQ